MYFGVVCDGVELGGMASLSTTINQASSKGKIRGSGVLGSGTDTGGFWVGILRSNRGNPKASWGWEETHCKAFWVSPYQEYPHRADKQNCSGKLD